MQASLDIQTMTKKTLHDDRSDELILALESSAAHASVAVIAENQLVHQLVRHEKHGHASYFVDMAADCLAEAGYGFGDLDAIAAGIGPGSFTGLRVCLSAAKGFVLAGDIKAYGINGLRARAFAAQTQYQDRLKHPSSVIIAAADTRRGPYFWQAFDRELNPLGDIAESEAGDIAIKAQKQFDDFIIAMPIEAEFTASSMADCTLPMDMLAKDIGCLAAEDRLKGINPSPLDPLYVAQPKLGPSAA